MSTITLPNIRVSSDLTVSVRLKDNGVAIDWSTLSNVKASIYSDAQRALAGRCDVSVDAEDPTVLVCQYAANKPQYVGVCRIVVSARYMGETKTYDKPAFNFVRWTADQDGEQITIDDPDVDVEIEVSDVSSSLLDEAIRAAFAAAEEAVDAKGQVLETEAEVEAAEALRVSAEESRVEAEEGRAEAEAARVDEEAVRVSAEDARVVAENARAAAEDLREGAEDDRAAAETARETAEAARVAAEALRVSAESSRETAEAAREAQASADHTVAAGDHTQAAADHTQAAADHTTAASDHTQAGADHTLAAADHVTAGEDHAQAQDDHEVMAGYDTRLGNVEGEVSQLEAEVNEKADQAELSQLRHEVTEIPKVTIPVSMYETGVVQQIEYELGNISIGSGGWVYSASNKRVRTPEGYVLHLYPGDVIGLTDYTNARFYASVIYLDNVVDATGWKTEDYTVVREGYACVLVSNLTEVAQTSAEALGSLIRVVRNTTIRKQVQKTGEDVSSIRREFGILVKGSYTQTIEAYSQTHSSTDDAIPVTIKPGETIKVTLRQGTGVCNGASVKCRFLNDSLVSQQETNITIGTEATIVSSVNASYVGFYFNKVTAYGTFYADIVVPVDFGVDITPLEQNKGAVVYLLPNTTPPNIDTTARTMTIPSSSVLVFNKNGYLLPNNNVVIDLSGVPSGNKKIVYDNSTQTFLCKPYSAVLTETQGVVALLKTDYEANGNWTVVYNVTANFDITIDGEGKYPQGDIVGFGSIAVQSKFKEIAHPLTVSQTIFDTTTNSVGIQSFGIYDDRYGIYIINATDSSNSAIQKVGCVIVDLADGTKLGEFVLPSTNTRTHGNNMNFGAKYDEADTFPLIYVSATYPPYECDVFRIANDYSSATLIQTITYGGTAHFAIKNSLDWIVGDGCLLGYAAFWDANSEYIEFVKFTMPDVTQSTKVLADSDVLDSFTVNGLRIAQGAIIRNGKIYIGLGYTQGVEYIKVVDIASRSVVAVVPISYEPEGVSIYKGHLAVSGSGLNFSFRTYIDAF